MQLLGVISVGIEVIDQILIRYLSSPYTGETLGYNGAVCQLHVYFENTYDSVRIEVI
jgi:hypothetical protein